MGFINLGRLNIRKRNSCASALVSLSDVQPPSVYKSHILNGPINKLYLSAISLVLRTCEITDIFNTFDEIYLVFTSKKVNILYLLTRLRHICSSLNSDLFNVNIIQCSIIAVAGH